jgi:glycosyltransferase involved in cell wall biosynthesis
MPGYAMTAPEFSVIMPTFRRPTLLRTAMQSALDQHDVAVEVIVMDDSPERSAEPVVSSFGDPRVRYLPNPHPTGGFPSIVRNLCWPHASGNFIHFLDDDDIVPTGYYATVRAAFAERPEVGLVYGRIEPFGDCPKEQLEQEIQYFAESARLSRVCQKFRTKLAFVACLMFQQALLVCSGGVVRRECMVHTRGFDPKLRLREDVDFYVQVMRRFGVHFIDQVSLKYRIGFPSLMHASALTERDQQQLQEARMHTNSKYVRDHGLAEFYALKLFARGFLRFL